MLLLFSSRNRMRNFPSFCVSSETGCNRVGSFRSVSTIPSRPALHNATENKKNSGSSERSGGNFQQWIMCDEDCFWMWNSSISEHKMEHKWKENSGGTSSWVWGNVASESEMIKTFYCHRSEDARCSCYLLLLFPGESSPRILSSTCTNDFVANLCMPTLGWDFTGTTLMSQSQYQREWSLHTHGNRCFT